MNTINEQPTFFSILIASVRYSEVISDSEKILFSEISALTNKYGYCNASNKYFATVFKKHENSISRMLRHLAKNKFIKITLIKDDNKFVVERQIRIILSDNRISKNDSIKNKNVNRISKNDFLSTDKNVKYNNTSIYNNNINNIYPEKNLNQKNEITQDDFLINENINLLLNENQNKLSTKEKIKKDYINLPYDNIKLTQKEYDILLKEYNILTDKAIKYLSDYKIEKNYKTKSDYLTIKRWVIDAIKKNNNCLSETEILENSKKFYDYQLNENKNNREPEFKIYQKFIKFILNNDSLNKPLLNVLKIKNQLTFKQFCEIFNNKPENLKITEALLNIQNNFDYYKNKEELFISINESFNYLLKMNKSGKI